MALQFLLKMPTNPIVTKYIQDEQKATLSYLTAKCHAKLNHHKEAMAALHELSCCAAATDELIQDDDFEDLAANNAKQFQTIAVTIRNVRKKRAPPEYELKLKKNEIAILSSVFDEYDEVFFFLFYGLNHFPLNLSFFFFLDWGWILKFGII